MPGRWGGSYRLLDGRGPIVSIVQAILKQLFPAGINPGGRRLPGGGDGGFDALGGFVFLNKNL